MREFTGDTFVDGSCVKVNEDDDLTQCGYAVVCTKDALADTQLDERENPDTPIRCGCRNDSNERLRGVHGM